MELQKYMRGGLDVSEAEVDSLWTPYADAQRALDAELEKVKGLHEITKVICTHCCEPMEIPSKAVLQTQLTQLQALVRALLDTWVNGRKIHDGIPMTLRQQIDATLDATTPAAKGGNGE